MRYSARLATSLATSRYSESNSLAVIRRDIASAAKRGVTGLVPVDNSTGNIIVAAKTTSK